MPESYTPPTTPHLGLPLPSPDAPSQREDVARVRQSLETLDSHLEANAVRVGAVEVAVDGRAANDLSNVSDLAFAQKMGAAGGGSATVRQSAPIYMVSGAPVTLEGQSILSVSEQIAGQTFALSYNTEADYAQQDAPDGTDLVSGAFQLHNVAFAVIDPYTKLLIHADGPDGSTEIVDERGITPFGSGCGYFDGTSYYTVPSSYKVAFGGQPFTVEAWVRPTTLGGNQTIFSLVGPGSANETTNPTVMLNGSNQPYLRVNLNNYYSSIAAPVDTWSHVAISFDGTNTRIFVNGQIGQTLVAVAPVAQRFTIGADGGGFNKFYGWMDEIRVSKVARYTSNFTPHTTPHVRDTHTVYLFHFEDGHGTQILKDDSRSGHEVYLYSGAALSTTQKKFGSTSLQCGSTANCALIAQSKPPADFAAGKRDFTLDFHFYPTSASGIQHLYQQGQGGLGQFFKMNGSTLEAFLSTNNSTWNVANAANAGTPNVNAWNHFALTRSGTSVNVYLNGTRTLSYTIGASDPLFSPANNLRISDGASAFSGFVDEFRFKIGIAEWTGASLTVPTAPYVADDRTILLLHFDGANGDKVTLDSSEASYGTAGITAAAVPVLTFNGSDCAFSSVQTRGGHATSCYLDGGNNYLGYHIDANDLVAGHPIRLGEAGCFFCVEGWFYDSGDTAGALISLYDGTGNTQKFALTKTSATGVAVTGPSVAAGTLVNNAWNHVALVKEPRGWVLYVNGTATGAPADVTTNMTYTVGNVHLFSIGGWQYITNFYGCYVDAIRITNGKPRYTSNFTPGNLTQDDDTALLWEFNGSVGQKWVKELSKNSAMIAATNARTVSDGVWLSVVNDTTNIATLSTTAPKFGTAALQMAAGISAYVKMPESALGTPLAAWALDCWVYLSNSSTYDYPFYWGSGNNVDNAMYVQFGPASSGSRPLETLWHTNNAGAKTNRPSGSWPVETWVHLAVVRSSDGSVRVYKNGSLVRTSTETTINYLAGTTFMRLATGTGTSRFDEMRISYGTDRGWTGSTIPVPTLAYGQQYVAGPCWIHTLDASRLDLSAFSSIDAVAVAASTPPGTSIKYAVSFDGRATWEVYRAGVWTTVTLADLDIEGMMAAELQAALLAWGPEDGPTLDVAASLKTTNPSFTPTLDAVTVTMDEYVMLSPVTDYAVKRKKAGGVQLLTLTRVKPGNALHVIDYI